MSSSELAEAEQHVLYDGGDAARARAERFRETRSGTRFDKDLSPEEERKAQHVARAEEAWVEGDTDLALYEYVRALVLDSKDVALYIKISRVHRWRGNARLAELALRKALEIAPDDVVALERLGLMRLGKRNYDGARELLERALAIDQRRLQEDHAGAIAELDSASPFEAYVGMGVVEDLAGNYTRAVAHYRRALAYKPLSAEVTNNLGYSYYLKGDLQQAEAHFDRAIALDRTLRRAWYNRALLDVRRGRFREAVHSLSNFSGDEASANNTVGYICMLEGKYAQAELHFARAIELSPSYFALAYENRARNQKLSALIDAVSEVPEGGEQ